MEEVVQPRVSLKVRAGEKEGPLFQDVLVYDLSCRLGDFLDAALKDLEVGAALREAPYYTRHNRGSANCVANCASDVYLQL